MSGYEHLAIRLKNARLNRGFSQKDLAKKTGIDPSYLHKIENSRIQYPPAEEKLKLLATILEIDEDELIFLAGKVPEKYSDLLKKHHKLLPILFRLLRENPRAIEKQLSLTIDQ